MFIVIGIIISGIVLGFIFQKRVKPIETSRVMTWIIYLLLLLLGILVGANEHIISNLHTLGLKALIITLGSILGSCLFAYLIYKYLFKKKGIKNER